MKKQMVALVMALTIVVAGLPQSASAATVDQSKITFPKSRTIWKKWL